MNWETQGVVWCGKEGVWSLSWDEDSLPIHRLQSPTAGQHILWGCPIDTSWNLDGQNWVSQVVWEQDVPGSNSNRSAIHWALPPAATAVESAWLLATSHEAGWLDENGWVSAGENGLDDPLHCAAPNLSPWSVNPTCHAWGQPFRFSTTWSWRTDGTWSIQAFDEQGRSQSWLDTLVGNPIPRPPCLGIEVNHTSSNGNRWAFGWRPQAMLSDSAVHRTWNLVDSMLVECLEWPYSPADSFLEVRLPCQGTSPHSPLPENSVCDNVKRWSLSCPIEEGGSVHVRLGEDVNELWRDGAAKLTLGDLAFTEVMPDPTPAIYAPESTYLEVLNVSSKAIDPQSLTLEDQGNFHFLEWIVQPQQGLVLPGDRFLIVETASAWENALLDGVAVLRAVGWNGLLDGGEEVALHGPNGEVESLAYFESWWQGAAQDGVALSCQSPTGCDHSSNWRPDSEGASPGMPASFESIASNAFFEAPFLVLNRTPESTLSVQPFPAWDPKNSPTAWFTSGNSYSQEVLDAEWTDDGTVRWEVAWPNVDDPEIHLTLTDVRMCLEPNHQHTLDTVWVGFPPPQLGQVLLTEILPARHPVVDAEFVEWTNVSNDTLSWGNEPWPPQVTLVQSSQPREAFQLWLGPLWLEDAKSSLWEVNPHLELPNARGLVELTDAWGNVVARSQYSRCGHSDDLGEAHGRSMECLPWPTVLGAHSPSKSGYAWRSEPGPKGMSPGVLAQWSDTTSVESLVPAHGVLDGRWAMTVPPEVDLDRWNPELWVPVTEWEPHWHEGVLLALASWGPDSLARGPVHVETPLWSFPDVPPPAAFNEPNHPEWNEVLANPGVGFSPFVEWAMGEGGSWTSSWVWTSKPWALAEDFTPIDDVAWWIPPNQETCLAECPRWVEQRSSRCLPAHVPSLFGNPELLLLTPHREVRLDLAGIPDAAWGRQSEGMSMARIPGTQTWTTTPPHVKSTPGKPNGPHPLLSSQSNSDLVCTPSTIQPGGSLAWDAVHLAWSHPQREDEFELEYGVFGNGARVQSHRGLWNGQGLEWTWRGTNEEGIIQPPGTYVGFVVWHNLSRGQRGTDRCLVAMAPH